MQKNKHRSQETKDKISKTLMGHKVSQKVMEVFTRKGESAWNKGKTWPEEMRKRISQTNKERGIKPKVRDNFPYGEKHPNWKGGITPLNHKIRTSLEYKLWRRAVFERDRFACIWCGEKSNGLNLNADHIVPFMENPELRFAIDNGRTLCVSCHRKRHHEVLVPRWAEWDK